MQLAPEDFVRIRDLVYGSTGLFFDERKILFLGKRLRVRMEEMGAESPNDYYRLLKFSDPHGREMQALVNLLTTNETYFFREFEQLAVFAEHCLPEICEKKIRLGVRRLRIWSAGCASGEEAYTLAIILREMIEEPADWLLEVLATDIDTNVLARAAHGVYDRRAVKDVPPEYLGKWFVETARGKFRVHPELKKICRFERLNFKDSLAMGAVTNIDFIFCRNVLIYFDDKGRQDVVGCFHRSLNPGGYIFLGHSESISRISSSFRLRRHAGTILYQKPEA